MSKESRRRPRARTLAMALVLAVVFVAGLIMGTELPSDSAEQRSRIEHCLPVQTGAQLDECLR
ncbi:hypothetical protein ND991_17985 [Gordonia sputi]|uniref:hypothetical protein n=1 Tax=Gordonia sputi TaxID=36823 RepID=UPI0020439F7A|nr:hypothetical protein [Gordonia sputi]MCM3897099.1 hypothetical protein [Gordonia sputi]